MFDALRLVNVDRRGLGGLKDLKVLTHEFEVESVLLKVFCITIGYLKTQKIGPRPTVGLP